MQFLKTLFWVVFAVIMVLFAKANWTDPATLKLWGGLEVDVKLPVLILAAFLAGFLPTLLIYRARLWSLKRRLEPLERTVSVPVPPRPPAAAASDEPRRASDSKAWPAA